MGGNVNRDPRNLPLFGQISRKTFPVMPKRATKTEIATDNTFDATLAAVRQGYDFIANRRERLGSDAFTTRAMLRKVTCVMGEDAARMFYAPGRFTRVGAMPVMTLMLLQDFDSVQMLDGAAL